MRGFEENNCRLCIKSFCCVKCRKKHESKVHNVVPECNICVFGQFVLEKSDEDLLQHIKESHLPLNCLYCFKIFDNIENILQNKKCSVAYRLLQLNDDDFTKTPFRKHHLEDDQDSPNLQDQWKKGSFNHLFNMATSTPMQKGPENINVFEKGNEIPLTPVDTCNKPQSQNKSIIKKSAAGIKTDSSSKRVTFGEPSENCIKSTKDKKTTPTTEKKTNSPNQTTPASPGCLLTPSVTGARSISSEQFYSAKSELTSSNNRTSFSARSKEKLQSAAYSGLDEPILTTPKTSNAGKMLSQDAIPTLEAAVATPHQVSMDVCSPRSDPPASEERTKSQAESSPSNDSQNSSIEEETPSAPPLPSCSESGVWPLVVLDDAAHTKQSSEQKTPPLLITSNKATSEQTPSCEDEDSKAITDGKTLWMSAVGLDKVLDVKHNGEQSPTAVESGPSQKPRISVIVMPTPVLKKTTDITMRYQLPSNFSSTPIMSTGAIKMRQTKIIEEVTSRVISNQTLYKTPQGKLFSLSRDSTCRMSTVSDIQEASGSSSRRLPEPNYSAIETAEICKENQLVLLNNDNHTSFDTSSKSVSVSSMTESSLWTSMSRVVRSVFESFTSKSKDFPYSNGNSSVAFKRQFSDGNSDAAEDYIEAHRSKRFKFTDIKCRRPIRDSYAMAVRNAAPRPVASLEILKSVSTFYNGATVKVRCDKATQTDEYLMYGWHPKI